MSTEVTTSTTEQVTSAATAVELLACEQLSAHTDNIRDASRGVNDLAKSMKEAGQFHPLIVVPVGLVDGTFDPTTTHVVIDGHRRLAAAQVAGIDHLRCEIRTDLAGLLEAKRAMLVTNLQRDAVTATEEAHAVQGMLDLGMSAAAISRATGRKAAQIKEAKKAATVTDQVAAQAHELTLTELAILADWQDNPEATAALIEAATEGQIEHKVAALEQEAREAAAIAALVATLGDVTILTARPSWDTPAARLSELVDADGKDLTEKAHTTCPGHAVYISTSGYDETTTARATPYCQQPKANGHSSRYGAPVKGGPMTEEEKAERKAKIAHNKEMAASSTVRLDFIRTVMTGMAHHKAAAAWALDRLIHLDRTYGRWANHHEPKMLNKVLGTEQPEKACREAPTTQHGLLLWAQVVSAYEAEMPKEAWQHRDPTRGRYLQHLVSLGYQPCDTELIIIGWATEAE